MRKLNLYNIIGLVAYSAITVLSSCTKDNNNTFNGNFIKGVFVINQGNQDKGNSSVSFYDRNSKNVINDAFHKVNQRFLGDIAQSIGETSSKYYIVVNNSNKVEIVNKSDFKSIGVITGFIFPRYFKAINDSIGYVTQWGNGAGQVKVINLKTNMIIKSIPTANGAEAMLNYGNYVYVANSGGSYNTDTVSVINSDNNELTANIVVGQNPQSMVEDKNGKIWVLCGGKWKTDWSGLELAGALVRINPANNTVEQTINFNSLGIDGAASSLTISQDKKTLSYIYKGSVYSLNVDAAVTDTTLKIHRSFYSIGVDPQSGYLYAADAGNFSTNGLVIRYDSNFARIDSFQAGVVPGYFFFN